jgi:hypothetical protein
VEANAGPGCWRHHPDKDRGWTLTPNPSPATSCGRARSGAPTGLAGSRSGPTCPTPTRPHRRPTRATTPTTGTAAATWSWASSGGPPAPRPATPTTDTTGTGGRR